MFDFTTFDKVHGVIKFKNSDYRMLVVSILFLALTVSFTDSFTVLFTFGHPLG